MQNNNFDIHAEWLSGQDSLPADARTARISIILNGVPLTKNINIFDSTHHDFFIAAPYPIALWFLDNWWRLCYEPTPAVPTTDWRMSHMLSSAGYGYSWPTIYFQSDSQNITITSIPTPSADVSSAFFSNAYSQTVSIDTFISTISTFINDCLLHAPDYDLENLYNTIQYEQSDSEIVLYRKLEAILGFDAGCGDEDRIITLLQSAQEFDDQAVYELSQFLYNFPSRTEEMQEIKKGTIGHKIDIRSLPMDAIQTDPAEKPWTVGYSLAKMVRKQWNLNGPVHNHVLCDRVALRAAELVPADRDDAVGLGARTEDSRFSLAFSKRSRQAMRFMFARGICDAILSSRRGSGFLAMTPGRTARQKMQRAFAAELLCPADEILHETDSVNDRDAIDYLAETYDVSTTLVESQLLNHGPVRQAEQHLLFSDTVWGKDAARPCGRSTVRVLSLCAFVLQDTDSPFFLFSFP